jgi:hypothetical protein
MVGETLRCENLRVIQSYFSFLKFSYYDLAIPENWDGFRQELNTASSLEKQIRENDYSTTDIKASDRRHLIFASDRQLMHLAKAKTWYIDGAFRLCTKPFVQLLSINAFVQKEDYAKQVPLVFVLMSEKEIL